jgi:hypothetical protein
MKSRKTLHEFTSHIPQKTPKRNISRSTNKMLHTDINVRAQGARVSSTHAREETYYYYYIDKYYWGLTVGKKYYVESAKGNARKQSATCAVKK